ncbi:hypothetical protein QO200_05340 [Flavobacterium sp. Arc3]|uniref:hypothetical protein n=1 Tax=Flavobacterium sp. Arc3 TaxID=3046686 RepID=UPI00352C7BA3
MKNKIKQSTENLNFKKLKGMYLFALITTRVLLSQILIQIQTLHNAAMYAVGVSWGYISTQELLTDEAKKNINTR